jgi:hypothetical protein
LRTLIRLCLTAIVLATPVAAFARQQTVADPGHAKTDVAGGFSLLRELPEGGGDGHDYKGWVISGARQLLFDRLLVVGEVGSNSRSNIVDETLRLRAWLAGARVRLTRGARLATFVQTLVGTERFSEPGLVQSGLAVQPGAGIDLRIAGPLGARVQADYRIARQDEVTYKEVRVAVGAVLFFDR